MQSGQCLIKGKSTLHGNVKEWQLNPCLKKTILSVCFVSAWINEYT